MTEPVPSASILEEEIARTGELCALDLACIKCKIFSQSGKVGMQSVLNGIYF